MVVPLQQDGMRPLARSGGDARWTATNHQHIAACVQRDVASGFRHGLTGWWTAGALGVRGEGLAAENQGAAFGLQWIGRLRNISMVLPTKKAFGRERLCFAPCHFWLC